jgi:outer membrane protein assembly factor BamD (BamD/ComL family)
MKLGRLPNGLALYRELASAGEAPTLVAPQVLPLATAAERAHDIKLALSLIKGFKEKFPGHPDIPGVQFFSARVALERLRNETIAREELKALIDEHPKHELAAEAKRYLEVLDRMGGKGSKAGQPAAG